MDELTVDDIKHGGEMKVRKKAVEVEAWPWPDIPEGLSVARVKATHLSGNGVGVKRREGEQLIETLEGVHARAPGDWLILGVKGEYYPCKPAIFDQTYDIVEET